MERESSIKHLMQSLKTIYKTVYDRIFFNKKRDESVTGKFCIKIDNH